jgi:SAM-dependent methyltransferase
VGVIDSKFLIKSFIQQCIEPAYTLLFPDWIQLLKREADNSDSILDLGCGHNSPIQYLHSARKVGVEENARDLEESEKKAVHQEYIRGNILEVTFPPRSFDIVFSFHTIEHLDRSEQMALLDTMQTWAKKKVVVVVRNEPGLLADFTQKGYRLYGMDGFKILRNTKGNLKYRPWYLFVFLSDLSQKIAYYSPSLASRLLAVKTVSV